MTPARTTIIAALAAALFMLAFAWAMHEAGKAAGMCEAAGYERMRVVPGRWVWDRPVACESTVYGLTQ